MKNKLWIKLFINITIIFAVFVIILTIVNSVLLENYYLLKEKRLLVEKTLELSSVSIDKSAELSNKITEISEKYNFEVEIYQKNGRVLYTTKGTQMMDFINSGFNRPNFSMNHEDFEVLKQTQTKDGAIIEKVISKFSRQELLLCKKEVDQIIFELRIQTNILENSASIASEFVAIIIIICLALSVIWVLMFSKKFTKPIVAMNNTTEKMAELDFTSKVTVETDDEIGQLGHSINNLSNKLDISLKELREANARLTDEIEFERKIDTMRKTFVANVSHELKTPLSVISGYAEGLKLNINSDSKDLYCDTIIDEAERMNKLVLSILELSKYESCNIPFKPEIFDLSKMISNMTDKTEELHPDINIINHFNSPITIFEDPIGTEQILKSYLENALAHIDEAKEITLDFEDLGEKLKIKVQNTGEKIDPEIMPNIWQSFWRADKSHSREGGRFGLGLSIVSAIVKAGGNSCGVYNTYNGVCFWFTVNKEQNSQLV